MKINICWSLLGVALVWANIVVPSYGLSIVVGLLVGLIMRVAIPLVPIYIQIDKTGIRIIDESY